MYVYLVTQSCPTLSWPHGLQPTRLLCAWGFSRQEYWNGLPCSPRGDLPNPGIKPKSPALQVDSLPSEPPGKHREIKSLIYINFQQDIIYKHFESLCRTPETKAFYIIHPSIKIIKSKINWHKKKNYLVQYIDTAEVKLGTSMEHKSVWTHLLTVSLSRLETLHRQELLHQECLAWNLMLVKDFINFCGVNEL